MRAVIAVIGAVALFASGAAIGAGRRSAWEDRYSPTKLDWATVPANAHFHQHCIKEKAEAWSIALTFMPKPPNSMLIVVDLRGDVPHTEYEKTVVAAKPIASKGAQPLFGVSEPLTFEVRDIQDGDVAKYTTEPK